jgi:hypothetical protein
MRDVGGGEVRLAPDVVLGGGGVEVAQCLVSNLHTMTDKKFREN